MGLRPFHVRSEPSEAPCRQVRCAVTAATTANDAGSRRVTAHVDPLGIPAFSADDPVFYRQPIDTHDADGFFRPAGAAGDPQRLLVLGADHNRFHVGEVFARLVVGSADPSDVMAIAQVLRDNPDAVPFNAYYPKQYWLQPQLLAALAEHS